MADQQAKMRHLAALIRGEHAIEAAANKAFAAWLPIAEAAVLGGTAGASIRPSGVADVDDDWDDEVSHIIEAVLALWLLRHKAAAPSAGHSRSVDGGTYEAQVRHYLRNVRNDAFKVVEKIARINQPTSYKVTLIRHALHPSQWESKAKQIGRTQAISAYNGGFHTGLLIRHQIAGIDSPTPELTWLAVNDSRVRDTHRIANGQTRRLGEKFIVGGFACDYPGDPELPPQEAIGCRCILTEKVQSGLVAGVQVRSASQPGRVIRNSPSVVGMNQGPDSILLDIEGGAVDVLGRPPGHGHGKHQLGNLSLDDQVGQKLGNQKSGVTVRNLIDPDRVPVSSLSVGFHVDDAVADDLSTGLQQTQVAVGDDDLLGVLGSSVGLNSLANGHGPVSVDQSGKVGFSGVGKHDLNVPPLGALSKGNASVTTPENAATPGVDVTMEKGLPNGWRGPIALLDGLSGDGRMLLTPPDGVRTRQYPMSVTREHVSQGTDVFIGNIDYAWVDPLTPHLLMAEGPWDLGGTDGREAARLNGEGMLCTMSIQPDEVTFEQRFINDSGDFVEYDEAVEPETAERGPQLREGYQLVDVMMDWRLASTAIVSIPAFDEARIEPVYDYKPRVEQPVYSDGSMIALRVQNPDQYAIEGGLSAEDLHITLHYLGDAADLAPEAVNAASFASLEALLALRSGGRHKATVAGYGTLGDKGAVVLFLNGGGILDAHSAADASLNDYGREAFAAPHEPFLAHMTLGYGLDVALGAQFVGQELTIHGVDFVHGTQNDFMPIVEPEPLLAAVTGNLGLPIAARDTKWDGHKARQVVAKWASSDGSGDLDKINWSKFGQAFLWKGKPQSGNALYADGGGAGGPRVEDFKLGFATVIDGKLTIVPNGAIGIAGGHGVTATKGIPAADKTAIKRKLCSLYSKIRSTHPEFPDCPFGSGGASVDTSPLVAAVGQVFRRDFFQDPKLDGPTPITITDDGHVFGHVALFGVCYQYMGADGRATCRMTPKGNDFQEFMTHGALVEDGEVLAVGALTFGDGHEAAGGLRASQRHYANVASVAAKVVVGEDEHGIWFSGQMLDSFDGDPSVVMYAPLSGHWEPNLDRRGQLSMIAMHSVVTAGFRVPRLVASVGDDGEIATFAVAAPQHVDESERAFLALERMGIGPNARARAALTRMGVLQ